MALYFKRMSLWSKFSRRRNEKERPGREVTGARFWRRVANSWTVSSIISIFKLLTHERSALRAFILRELGGNNDLGTNCAHILRRLILVLIGLDVWKESEIYLRIPILR